MLQPKPTEARYAVDDDDLEDPLPWRERPTAMNFYRPRHPSTFATSWQDRRLLICHDRLRHPRAALAVSAGDLDRLRARFKECGHWLYRAFFRSVPHDDKVKQIIALAVAMLVIRLLAELSTDDPDDHQHPRRLQRPDARALRPVRETAALSLAYHRVQPQGDAIYRLSSDTNGFQSLLNIATGILVNIVTLIAMAVIMFSYELGLTLVQSVGRSAAAADDSRIRRRF